MNTRLSRVFSYLQYRLKHSDVRESADLGTAESIHVVGLVPLPFNN